MQGADLVTNSNYREPPSTLLDDSLCKNGGNESLSLLSPISFKSYSSIFEAQNTITPCPRAVEHSGHFSIMSTDILLEQQFVSSEAATKLETYILAEIPFVNGFITRGGRHISQNCHSVRLILRDLHYADQNNADHWRIFLLSLSYWTGLMIFANRILHVTIAASTMHVKLIFCRMAKIRLIGIVMKNHKNLPNHPSL